MCTTHFNINHSQTHSNNTQHSLTTTQACQYQQAAFCLEEVLSMGPLAPLMLLKYADVLATLGSPSQLKAARAYYSQALRVRACVWGEAKNSLFAGF